MKGLTHTEANIICTKKTKQYEPANETLVGIAYKPDMGPHCLKKLAADNKSRQ